MNRKEAQRIVIGLVGLLPLSLCAGQGGALGRTDVRTFAVNAMEAGSALPNPSQMLTSWFVPELVDPETLAGCEWDVREFAEWVEIMAATGGNASRDGYRDPKDRSVTDDYDFSKLVRGCRSILALGMKPYLKLGNVPMKLSSDISTGDFSINVRPPDDFAAYARYMAACAKALRAAFGKEELLEWRYAVLTEYENAGWFQDVTKDPERTFHAYCLLYEKTVETFSREVSPDLTFGAHAMAMTEGLWDERRFLSFVAVRKLPLKFVTASFYDTRPGVFTSGLTLPKTIAHLRDAAETAGLANLFFGVDEGRMWGGESAGKDNRALPLRIVGDTYQAAYDARIVRQLFDSGAEYFSAWGYFSGPNTWFDGVPSVSFHVAREAAKFKGLRRLSVTAEGSDRSGLESAAVAAVDEAGRTIRIMAYSFTNDLHAAGTVRMRFAVHTPESWRGRAVRLVRRRVDDGANWFPQWRKDRKALGLADDRFSWSPDDPAVLSGHGLVGAKDRETFQTTLLPRYRTMARLEAVAETVECPVETSLVFDDEMQVNSALFAELALQADDGGSSDR